MPRGARRNFRPVIVATSQPIAARSSGIWPTDWHASRKKGTSAALASRPTSATGFTRPQFVPTWVAVTSRARSSSAPASASRSTPPPAVDGTTTISKPQESLGLQQREVVRAVRQPVDDHAITGAQATAITRPQNAFIHAWLSLPTSAISSVLACSSRAAASRAASMRSPARAAAR